MTYDSCHAPQGAACRVWSVCYLLVLCLCFSSVRNRFFRCGNRFSVVGDRISGYGKTYNLHIPLCGVLRGAVAFLHIKGKISPCAPLKRLYGAEMVSPAALKVSIGSISPILPFLCNDPPITHPRHIFLFSRLLLPLYKTVFRTFPDSTAVS